MQQTADEWALPLWESQDLYGLAGTVPLQPQFANAISAALTQAKLAVTPKTVTAAMNADTLTEGTWRVPHMAAANLVANLPVTWPGTLTTTGEGGVRTQVFTPAFTGNTAANGADLAALYARRTNQSGGWNEWQPIGGPAAASSREGALRLAGMRQRIGAVKVTTPATVAIVMDHGLTNVKSKVLPLMRARGLRATLAINSRKWADASNSGATQADVKTWGDVFEFANHGADHLLTGNPAHDREEIEEGRRELEVQLGVPIDTYVQTGNGSAGSYDFDDGRTEAAYWTTETGRVIARTHAVWTGLVPHATKRYPIDGHPKPGAQGVWIDQFVSPAMDPITAAIADGTGVIVRLHPQFLDTAGNLTTAELAAFLDWLVAHRSNRQITVLPYREWSVAQTAGLAGRDTGWRSLTGGTQVRRVGDAVYVQYYGNLPAGTGNVEPDVLPLGFRPKWHSDDAYVQGTTIGRAHILTNGAVRLYSVTASAAFTSFSDSYATTDPWPTTLPGSPA